MLLSNAIKFRINELMKFNNIDNIHQLTLLAGIPYATLNDFYCNKTRLLKIDKISIICDALNLELKDFFDSSLFKDLEYDGDI